MIHLSYIVYNKPIKDNLIGSVLYLYKNEKEKSVTFGICFKLLQTPKQIYETLTFTLILFSL